MKIDPTLNPISLDNQTKGNSTNLVTELSNSFRNVLDEVNSLQLAAESKIEEFTTTKEKDIHGTMIAMQKADISLRLLLQVRSKLTTAYQEIIRMQL